MFSQEGIILLHISDLQVRHFIPQLDPLPPAPWPYGNARDGVWSPHSNMSAVWAWTNYTHHEPACSLNIHRVPDGQVLLSFSKPYRQHAGTAPASAWSPDFQLFCIFQLVQFHQHICWP